MRKPQTPEARKERINRKAARYRAKYRERLQGQGREYYAEHRADVLAYRKRYYAANADKIKAQSKEYRITHSDHCAHYARVYSMENADKIRARCLAYYRSGKGKDRFMRARKRHQDSPFLKENKYHLLWIENRPCEVCGSYAEREVDHIIEQSKGGSDELDNLRVLCFTHHRKAGNGRHSTWREGD